MKAIDLTQLIKGLLGVIFVSIALGKYGNLQDFARREAAASLRGWHSHIFFPRTYQRVMSTPSTASSRGLERAHRKGTADLNPQSHFDHPKKYQPE